MVDRWRRQFNLLLLLVFFKLLCSCAAVLPTYTPALYNGNSEQADLVESYFHFDFGYKKILLLSMAAF